ncbi:MAG TPA: hypothetical protein VH187_05605 [Scandinavium sp.]|jgi:hypothetical protein|uniref:hypothetical protein n=1 Tax=Scandinavium sp. TaxID=2830653 RepID=UPI002E32CCDB|nr:hypothetical protein [Scandinavium sp.]HEX4500637.1 hypothetical protein [Scandinavium sp.]
MTNPLGTADPLSPVEMLEDGDIDLMVPPRIMRLAQHLHNLIYIRAFYESIGQQPPEWTKREMGRAEKVLLSELDREHSQGGAFRKGDSYETRKSG